MKKLIFSAAFVTIGTFVMAQQATKMHKMDPAQMEQKRGEHMLKMKTDLNLSDAQVAKIKALQDQRIAERKQIAPQKQAERKAKMEQMKAKRMQHQAEMKQILTPEQYQKWHANNKGRMHNKGKMMKGKKMMMIQKAK